MFGGVLANLTKQLGKVATKEEAGRLGGLLGESAVAKLEPKGLGAFTAKFAKSTGDKAIDGRISEVVNMSPDDYLQKAFNATDGKLGGSYDSWMNSNAVEPATTKLYSEAMKRGDEFPMAYIDNAMGSQDGRNRALAVKMAGGKEMPVGIIPEMTDAQSLKFYTDKLATTDSNYSKHIYQKKIDNLSTRLKDAGADKYLGGGEADLSSYLAPKNMGAKNFKTPVGRTPNVIKDSISGEKIHPDDQRIMADFIDHARGIKKLTPSEAHRLEIEASSLAEHYGIKMPPSIKKLAGEFDKRLVKDNYRGEMPMK